MIIKRVVHFVLFTAAVCVMAAYSEQIISFFSPAIEFMLDLL